MYETVSQTTYTYFTVQQPLPPPNYPVIHSQPVPDPNFVTYGAHPPPNYYTDPNAIPVTNEAFASASQGTSMNNNLFGQTPRVSRKKQKKPKGNLNKGSAQKGSVSQSVFCNLCKIECNSVQLYEKHLTGKKHNKSFKKMYVSAIASAGLSSQSGDNAKETGALNGQGGVSVPPELEAKKQKLLECGAAAEFVRVCTICNVACISEKAFYDHLAGKKHISQERAKNPTLAGLLTCQVCKIVCNSDKDLVIHQQGQKHKKNVEKLHNSRSDFTGPFPSSTHLSPVSMPTVPLGPVSAPTSPVGPVSVPTVYVSPVSVSTAPVGATSVLTVPVVSMTASSVPVDSLTVPTAPVDPLSAPTAPVDLVSEPVQRTLFESEQVKKKGARSVMGDEDLETKKRKIVECGADAGDVRTCSICNVVCNNELVFNSHLVGQKHALKVKRAAAVGSPGNQLITGST